MRVKGIPSNDALGDRTSETEEEITASSFPCRSYQFCSSLEDRRRDKRESQMIEIMNRVLETMEKNEKRMEDVDKKDVIKLEWQQAALIVDRYMAF